MKKLIISLLFIMVGCGINYTKQDVNYIKKVNAIDLNQRFPISQENEIWGKTQMFISQYVKTRIQIVTPELIQTYQVENEFTWNISKIKYDKDFQLIINVQWLNSLKNMSDVDEIMEPFQAKALLHYLLTGEVVPKLLNCYQYDCKKVAEPDKIKTKD